MYALEKHLTGHLNDEIDFTYALEHSEAGFQINTLRQGLVTTLLNLNFGQKIREFRKRLDIIEHDWYNSKIRECCNTALCMREVMPRALPSLRLPITDFKVL